MPQPKRISESPWPHRWSVLLVCATFPLIWVGGLVTSTDAGMAVPDWPNTYGYNLFLYPWKEWFLGPWDLFIEHGHRLLGALVGFIVLGLLAVLLKTERRKWVKVFGVILLFGVVGQGVLGGLRVLLDARLLAMIHGCTGPLFFLGAVAMAVVTSKAWQNADALEERSQKQLRQAAIEKEKQGKTKRKESKPSLHNLGFAAKKQPTAAYRSIMWLAIVCTVFTYSQITLGAQIRHVLLWASPFTFRMHALAHVGGAFVLLSLILWLAVMSRSTLRFQPWITRPALILAGLVFLQILLGSFAWVTRFSFPLWVTNITGPIDYTAIEGSPTQAFMLTLHAANGSLIFVTSLVVALRSGRLASVAQQFPKKIRVPKVTGVFA